MEFRISYGNAEIRVVFALTKIKQAQDTAQYEDTYKYNQYLTTGSAL
jgi:hypothetical protein